MFIIKNLTIIFLLLLFGCADKSHTVINTYNPGDNNLTCAEIQNEVIKAELIIDAVKKDKKSISGAEVLDAVMWGFIPAITKGQNHKKAVEAANAELLNDLADKDKELNKNVQNAVNRIEIQAVENKLEEALLRNSDLTNKLAEKEEGTILR